MGDLVLVTGGAGFVGSHLVERLLDRGYRVRVLDNLSFGRPEWVDARAELIVGDIQDLDTCRTVCEGVRGVFHAAAMSRAGPSIDAAEFCTAQNIVGTQNMLVAARDAGVKRFVYSGSSTYYGNQPGPQTEDMKPDCLNFYAMSKFAGEELCRLFDKVFPIECVILRYFNVYGPRQPETGAYALVLGIFLSRWVNQQTLEIHGTGDQRRDFVYVTDVADANIAAYESDVHGTVYNVGSGSSISIQELADLISERQTHTDRRPGDAQVTLADISRTTDALHWTPKVAFADGLETMKRIAMREMPKMS
ncbi:MAG: NAD-dependent epimerase/dehydratase family protein [Ancalomicrobiaceae bacterium]|nr:NAD-dependent epimerase/dehydratase family protein [Ancalomicrobiaceae bacterium]